MTAAAHSGNSAAPGLVVETGLPQPGLMPAWASALPAGATMPMTAFERFLLASEGPGVPMTFVYRMVLDGAVEPRELRAAVEQAVGKHPLLACRVNPAGTAWIWAPPATIAVRSGLCAELPDLDLRQENGLRIHAGSGGEDRTLDFVFHHACLDGLGALHFLRDVSRSLAKGGDEPVVSEAATQAAWQVLHRCRDAGGGSRWWHLLRWPLDLAGMAWAFEMVWNRPIPLEQPQLAGRPAMAGEEDAANERAEPFGTPDDGQPRSGRGWLAFRLTGEQTALVRQNARQVGQTLNDRVIAALFRAATGLLPTAGEGGAESPLVRVMVPVNLRKNDRVPAANMVAMVNLDRRVGRWRSERTFRRWLRWEMQVVKWSGCGVTANRFLQLQRWWLGRWPMLDSPPRCLASCLSSNLGDLAWSLDSASGGTLRFGDRQVESFGVRAPLRPHSNLFVCFFTQSGQLNFNLTFDPDRLDDATVGRWFAVLRERLLEP